jgi:chaperonin GroEL
MKKILFGNDARQQIKAGIDKCVDVVKVSYGAKGKNVLIFNGSNVEIINDGVSIAREVSVKDEIEQAGIQLAKQCANQTNEDAGDGTTTTLVLLQSILKEIITEFSVKDPRELREDLFKEINEVLEKVERKEVKSRGDVYNLALTSSLDQDIAKTIADIYDELGKNAQISIEETHRDVIEKEIINGIKFESKRPDLLKVDDVTLEDCGVLVLDKVEDKNLFEPRVIEEIKKGRNSLVILANKFSKNILISIMKIDNFKIIPIEYSMMSPLDDISDYVGEEPAKRIIITNESTTILEGKGNVTDKIEKLREKLAKEESAYERENLERRIAQLLGKVAIIRIGKNTDIEREEIVLKLEDALGTVKGAYELGYTKGGGKALLEACGGSSDIVKRICETPSKIIGDDVPDTVIDSYKTVKYSLLNALSVATSVSMVESCLIEVE